MGPQDAPFRSGRNSNIVLYLLSGLPHGENLTHAVETVGVKVDCRDVERCAFVHRVLLNTVL